MNNRNFNVRFLYVDFASNTQRLQIRSYKRIILLSMLRSCEKINTLIVMLNYPKLWIILLDLKINDLSSDVYPDFALNVSLKIITLLGLIKKDYPKFFN